MSKLRILLVFGLAAFSTACASHDIKTVQLLEPSEYNNIETSAGLTIGIELYDTDAKTLAAFDSKLVRKGIYPIQVSIRSSSQTELLIVRSQITIQSETTADLRPMTAEEVAEEVENNAMANAIFGFGIFSYAAAKDANEERQADFVNKQVPDEWIVRPNRLSGGFLFFKFPKGQSPAGKTLVIPVETMGTGGQTTEARLPL